MAARRLRERLVEWARRLKRDGLTLWFAGKHPRTPLPVRLLAAVVVAYALSPIDLVPDFIPVLGYLDDLLLLPGLIWLTVRLLPADVLADARQSAEDWIARAHARPRSRWGAWGIVALWLLAAAAVVAWL